MSPAGRNPTRGILSGGHDCAGNARLMVERVTWQETRPSRSRPVSHTLFSFPVGKETFGRRGRDLVVLCPRHIHWNIQKCSASKWKKVGRKEGRKRSFAQDWNAAITDLNPRRDETRRDEGRKTGIRRQGGTLLDLGECLPLAGCRNVVGDTSQRVNGRVVGEREDSFVCR